ncbi:MAG: hypothetical protein QG629_251 [Patescibacteria group bacterium]|nr:hypothetical protein [Candidatus Saccharibacteria bacterium]MDQ5963169.1 hypothetical protein [Patescibacteria group bacterium]
MASDKQEFTRAVERWEGLHAAQRYSAPPQEGATAILYSLETIAYDAEDYPVVQSTQMSYFREEAQRIADDIEFGGGAAHVFSSMSMESMALVLQEEMYSDVIIIGHGALGSVFCDVSADEPEKITWKNVSKLASHLKLGSFVQRTCAGIEVDMPVPLGAFAVTSHANLIMPQPGQPFAPELHGESEEAKLGPFTKSRCITLQEIKAMKVRAASTLSRSVQDGIVHL